MVEKGSFKRAVDVNWRTRSQTLYGYEETSEIAYAALYAAKNFPEIGWLEILPKEEGKEVRETYIVYESLERAFQRIRAGEYPPERASD